MQFNVLRLNLWADYWRTHVGIGIAILVAVVTISEEIKGARHAISHHIQVTLIIYDVSDSGALRAAPYMGDTQAQLRKDP